MSLRQKAATKKMISVQSTDQFRLNFSDYNQNNSMPNMIIAQVLYDPQNVQTLQNILQTYRTQIQAHVIETLIFTFEELRRKYQLLSKKYQKCLQSSTEGQWFENEKKVFITVLIAFCYSNQRKLTQIADDQWRLLSAAFNNKHILLLKYELDSIEIKEFRVSWSHFQKSLLQQHINVHPKIEWAQVSRYIYFKSFGACFKSAKQCREHWFNYLNNRIVKGGWEVAQDLKLLQAVLENGKKWAKMVILLQNKRTQHMIKNRFHSLMVLARKLLKNNAPIVDQRQMIVYLKQKLENRKKLEKTHSNQISNSAIQEKRETFSLDSSNKDSPKQTSIQVRLNRSFDNKKSQFSDFRSENDESASPKQPELDQIAQKIKIQHIQDSQNVQKKGINSGYSNQLHTYQTNPHNLVWMLPPFYLGQPYPCYYKPICSYI